MTPALLLLALQAAPQRPAPAVQDPPPPALPDATAQPPAPVDAPAEPAPTALAPQTTPLAPQTPLESQTPLAPFINPPASLAAPATGVPDAIKYRRLVFANTYVLNFGVLYPIPSGDLQLYLGTNLRPRRRAAGGEWNTAIGYQLTLSLGTADYSTIALSDFDPYGRGSDVYARLPIFFHRHHITAMGHGGARGRLYYAFGGGAVLWLSDLAGIEAEGKLGYIFSAAEGRRLRGVVGGQARLGAAIGGVPLPQFGLFVGFMVF